LYKGPLGERAEPIYWATRLNPSKLAGQGEEGTGV
jgi:hypothetical protein